ncbi:MAG: hypothetical protein AAGE80_02955 [Pseudomonadota bacterium]
MGSPIDSFEGAGAIFTGAGGSSPMIFLILSVILCVAIIAQGCVHEEHLYNKHK